MSILNGCKNNCFYPKLKHFGRLNICFAIKYYYYCPLNKKFLCPLRAPKFCFFQKGFSETCLHIILRSASGRLKNLREYMNTILTIVVCLEKLHLRSSELCSRESNMFDI